MCTNSLYNLHRKALINRMGHYLNLLIISRSPSSVPCVQCHQVLATVVQNSFRFVDDGGDGCWCFCVLSCLCYLLALFFYSIFLVRLLQSDLLCENISLMMVHLPDLKRSTQGHHAQCPLPSAKR